MPSTCCEAPLKSLCILRLHSAVQGHILIMYGDENADERCVWNASIVHEVWSQKATSGRIGDRDFSSHHGSRSCTTSLVSARSIYDPALLIVYRTSDTHIGHVHGHFSTSGIKSIELLALSSWCIDSRLGRMCSCHSRLILVMLQT